MSTLFPSQNPDSLEESRKRQILNVVHGLNNDFRHMDFIRIFKALADKTENKDGEIILKNGATVTLRVIEGKNHQAIAVTLGDNSLILILRPVAETEHSVTWIIERISVSTPPAKKEREEKKDLVWTLKDGEVKRWVPHGVPENIWPSEELDVHTIHAIHAVFSEVANRYKELMKSPEQARARDLDDRRNQIYAQVLEVARGVVEIKRG